MNHPFFEDINFETILDEMPPEKLELTQQQLAMRKYLPSYRQANTSSSSLLKQSAFGLRNNQSHQNLSLINQARSENGAGSGKPEEHKENHDSDDSYMDAELSPTYKKDKSLDFNPNNQKETFGRASKFALAPAGMLDAHTPNFDSDRLADRTMTANFGADDY